GLAHASGPPTRMAGAGPADAARRLDVVIANPTYMLGPYDAKPSSGKLVVEIVRGKVPGWTLGRNNFVDVRDVARGMILVAEKGRRGGRSIPGGPNTRHPAAPHGTAPPARVPPP